MLLIPQTDSVRAARSWIPLRAVAVHGYVDFIERHRILTTRLLKQGYKYRNLPIIRPWARKLSGSSKRGVGLFSSVLIFHSKVRPPYMLYT